MNQEQLFKKYLVNWQPKHANVNFKKNQWQESTLLAYMDVLKHIVDDLKIDTQKKNKNLLDYHDAKAYFIIYKEIIDHPQFKSLQYYPIAKKALKRYLDFLYEQKV